MELPIKMQSVMMTGVRGPDNHRYESIKVLNRWVRSNLFHDADPFNPFIVKPGDPMPEAIVDQLCVDVEYTTTHYFAHLIHTLEIIGYKQPDLQRAAQALLVWSSLCKEVLHLPLETQDLMEARLGDR